MRNILADNWLHIQKFKATELTSLLQISSVHDKQAKQNVITLL